MLFMAYSLALLYAYRPQDYRSPNKQKLRANKHSYSIFWKELENATSFFTVCKCCAPFGLRNVVKILGLKKLS
jgi:hypothetical protein